MDEGYYIPPVRLSLHEALALYRAARSKNVHAYILCTHVIGQVSWFDDVRTLKVERILEAEEWLREQLAREAGEVGRMYGGRP